MRGLSLINNWLRGKWMLALPFTLVIFSLACSMPALRKTASLPATPTLPPTATPLPTPTQRALPPALVESSPPSGAELPLEGQITLVFNQAMDRPSVETALKVRAFLISDLVWSDDATVTINPGDELPLDSSLTVEVGTEARSSSGLALLRPVNLEYHTAGYLQPTQQLPEPNTVEVNPTSAIVVAFNHPIVPLGADPAVLPPAFTLDPAVEGRGEWINTSTYIFYPEPGLGGGQSYTVQLDPTLHGINGNPLQLPDDAWSFTTAMPKVMGNTGYFDEHPSPIDGEVKLDFNQSMDRDSVEANFLVRDPAGNPAAGSFKWDAADSSVTWTPSTLLARQTLYTLTLDGAAQALGGTPLGETLQFTYPTVPELSITQTVPLPGGMVGNYESIILSLSGPIKDSNPAELLKFSPAVPNKGAYYDVENRTLSVFGTFAPATDYTLTVSPTLSDPWGSTLGGETGEPFTLNFRSAPLPPGLVIGMGGAAHTLTSEDQSLAAQITGINDLPLSIGSTPLEDFIRLANDYEFRQAYRAADQQSWSQTFAVDPNQTQDVRLYLSPDQGSLPTGFYMMRAEIPNQGTGSEPQLLVVSDQNLIFKISATDALVWAVQRDDGAPLTNAPVAIYDSNGELLTSGQMDAQGVFSGNFPARENPYNTSLAVIGQPGDKEFAAAFSDWNRAIEPWSFDLRADYQGPSNQAYLYTDRPIYRPGQSVFFRAIARQAYNGRYEMVDGKNLTVKLNDDIGQEIDSQDLPLSTFGTINGKFDLPAGLRPGNYSINIPEFNNAYIGVPVADYRKPEIDLKIDFSEEELLAGQNFQAVVNARYFFDAPAGNVPIEWYLYSKPASFDIPGYTVGLQGASQWFSSLQPGFGSVSDSGKGVTQPDGTLVLDLGPAQTDASRQAYTLEATAQDESGLPVSVRAEIPVNPANYYIGLRPDSWIAQANQALGFDVITADLDQAPNPNTELRAEFAKVEWIIDDSQPPNPFYGDIYKPLFTLVGSTDFQTGGDGQARLEFTPPEPGAYQLSVFSRRGADAEAPVRSEMLVWAGGPGQFVLPDQHNRHIELIAGQDGYKPGNTAQVFIPNPFPDNAQALISVERGKILSSEIKTLEAGGSTLKFPLTGDDAPNIYISVTLLGKNDQGKPDFRQGYLKIPVEPSEQTLNVQITRKPEVTGPGGKVDFELLVTDSAGKPVEGEFSLAVVDVAALKLADTNSLNIVPAFYDIQPLGVNTAISLLVYASDEVEKQEFGGGGGGGGDGTAPSVRERFPDTAFWQGDIITGADGKAQVTVQLPDNLTTWQVESRGVTQNTHVGQTKTDVVTTKELIVRPVTPRFLVAGDHLELAAIVQNNTTQPITGEVALQSDGVTLDDPGTLRQAFTVPANGRQRISWWGTVEDLPTAKLIFSAEANNGALQDAARPAYGDLPILRYSSPQTFRTAGTLDEAGQQLELVSLPRFFDPTGGNGSLDLELSPSLGAAMVRGLDVLDGQNCQCTELILSRFLPNLEIYRTFQTFGLQSTEMKARLEQNLDEGMKTLLNRQNYDGGWGWWPGGESDPHITAYILFGLTRAKGAGVLSAEPPIQRAVEYLKSNFIAQPLPEETWELDRLAFANFALSQADAAEQESMNTLYQERSRLSPWTQALLALGMERSALGGSEARTLFSDLQSSAVRSAAGAHWELADGMGANMTSTLTNSAIVAYALAVGDPAAPLSADAARYLTANRQADGAWTSSYTTAWTLMALNEIMKTSGELGGDFSFGAALNDASIASGEASGADQLTPVTTSIPLNQVYPNSPNLLAIERDAGKGRLYYSTILNVSQPADQVEPLSNGLTISREYLPAVLDCTQEDCTPIDSARPGEKVTVRLALTLPNDVYHLMVEDYIPAGAEILDMRLKTSQQGEGGEAEASLPYDPQNPFAKGWGWWLFNEASIYDDHILWSANHLPAGTYELTYSFVPLQAGEFQVLPAHAWEFYFPEVQATSAGSKFTIK